MKLKNETKLPADSQAITALETRLGKPLPTDYRSFLAENNGGTPEQDSVFPVEDLAADVTMGEFFGLGQDQDIVFWLNEMADELTDAFLPIGTDAASNVVLLNLGDGSVYYWDAVNHFPQSSVDSNTYWVADSFTAFLASFRSATV